MRFAAIVLCLLFVAGCDNRSLLLPQTDKWVRFHCMAGSSQRPVCMVEMPGKPRTTTITKQLLGNPLYLQMHSYECGSDGMFAVTAIKKFDEDIAPNESAAIDDQETLHDFEAQMQQMMGSHVKLLSKKTFLFQEKYDAFEITAEAQEPQLAPLICRGRFINYKNYAIILIVVGNSSVVREPEVTYFFDSLLLYK